MKMKKLVGLLLATVMLGSILSGCSAQSAAPAAAAPAAESAAGLYAAKEAFLKARGTGIDSLALSKIEVAHDPQGRPYYRLDEIYGGEAFAAHLSISHDGGVAAAVCVLEQRAPGKDDGNEESV